MKASKDLQELETKRKSLLEEWEGRHFTNMLDEMMRLQKSFGKKFVDFDNLSVEEKERWTKEFIICCLDELSEILNCTNHRHWKTPIYPINEIEIKYEIIDLLHFVLSLMLVWGMSPEEVFSVYVTKNRENNDRQKRGY